MPGKATSKIKLIVDSNVKDAIRDLDRTDAKIYSLIKSGKLSSEVFSKVGTALKGFASALAIKEVATYSIELAKLADAAKQVEGPFRELVNAAGKDLTTAMEALRKAVRGTISDLELMQRTGAAMDAFISSGMDASEAFKATQETMDFLYRYSVKFGKNFNDLMQTVFTGLQRGSALFLDDVGIMINQTDAQFKGLNEVQKKAAIVRVALEKMAEKNKLLGEVTEGANVQTMQASAAFDNLKVAIGSVLEEPVGVFFGVAADIMNELAEAITGVENRFISLQLAVLNKLAPSFEKLLQGLDDYSKGKIESNSKFMALKDIWIQTNIELEEAKKNLELLEEQQGFTQIQDELAAAIERVKAEMSDLPEFLDSYKEKQDELNSLTLQYQAALNDTENASIAYNEQQEKVDELAKRSHESFKLLRDQVIELRKELNVPIEFEIKQKNPKAPIAPKTSGRMKTKTRTPGEYNPPSKEKPASPFGDPNEDRLLNDLYALDEFYNAKYVLAAGNEEMITQLRTDHANQRKAIMDELYHYEVDKLLASDGILDTFTNSANAAYNTFMHNLLDAEMTGKEKREAIWDALKNTFIQNVSEKLTAFIKSKTGEILWGQKAELLKTQAHQQGVAQRTALDSAEIMSSNAATAAKTSEAASGFFKAHSGIPYVGYAIAAAFVAAMLAMMSGIGRKSTGGIVTAGELFTGFVPEGEDGLIGVQAGERVMSKKATARFNPQLEAMEKGNIVVPSSLKLPEGYNISSISAPQPVSTSQHSSFERVVERVPIPIEGNIVVSSAAPDTHEVKEHYIRVNREILRKDNEYIDVNLQTEKNPFQ